MNWVVVTSIGYRIYRVFGPFKTKKEAAQWAKNEPLGPFTTRFFKLEAPLGYD